MEKKVPERKVTLKDDDIIYVYDKRINKCIREDCEGVVKYGLVLITLLRHQFLLPLSMREGAPTTHIVLGRIRFPVLRLPE